ncbi:response regulator [Flavobacterium sp. NRK F10]|uniref:Response regulatory domain-containing protein n=1 Tax=Flavobacterium sediminis TaxID=2201181 RepID=A0A2U8QS80_9FLAO|nr:MULTISPECIES: response regulator [Flavobacterium]AWM13020.1 hypothetical protein DI487_03510 [Flavobacterium sediminis]MCO6174176.1 response regulator [Flavobacterium sp. NRK F10]
MDKSVKCIMLIDDNEMDNFVHERVIKKHNAAEHIVAKQSALEALHYLEAGNSEDGNFPNIIFLDINMPGMDGWEFLEEYGKLEDGLKDRKVVVILTTSENPEDFLKAKKAKELFSFKTKPLTKEILDDIIEGYLKKFN